MVSTRSKTPAKEKVEIDKEFNLKPTPRRAPKKVRRRSSLLL